MFNLGPWEIAAVVVVALLIFGPRKLPEIGKAIGSAINEFKGTMSGATKMDEEPSEPKKIEEKAEEDEDTPAG